MPVKKLKPLGNSSRHTILIDYKKSGITNKKPPSHLLEKIKKRSGKDAYGHISVRHRGGGSKRFYRIIDFKRNKYDVPGKIFSFDYDPNRNSFLALIVYADGDKRYILQPGGVKIGDTILASKQLIEPIIGHSMPLKFIPEGTPIHNIEMNPLQGGKLVRAAGARAQLLGFDDTGDYAIIKFASGETRKILKSCAATVGAVGNEDYRLINVGKAGRNRWAGKRPSVRGAAMNRTDHPHGGGEGKSPIGHPSPMTPWGKKAYGVKTRNKKKPSTKLIIRQRNARKK